MLKGINKNVIVVSTDPASRFESVFFVLRRGQVQNKSDIIKEANRIISDSDHTCKSVVKKIHLLVAFSVGALTGALLTLLVGFLVLIC